MTECEKKTYSCYCLFDDCCLSKAKNETINELSERLHGSAKIKYQEMIKSGLCECKYCNRQNFPPKAFGF